MPVGPSRPLSSTVFFPSLRINHTFPKVESVPYTRPSAPNARCARGCSVIAWIIGSSPITACQPSPGCRIAFRNTFCDCPAKIGCGQSFHSQRIASGNATVPCLHHEDPHPRHAGPGSRQTPGRAAWLGCPSTSRQPRPESRPFHHWSRPA